MAKIIAHRGFAKINKENTIPAFEYAAKSKCFGIETDIHVTLDNQFVTFHDETTKRLCGRHIIVAKTNLEALQKIKIRHRHKRYQIPTLSEYLALCKKGNKRAVIEFKCDLTDEQLGLFVDIINKEFSVNDSIFISFTAEILKKLRVHFPDAKCQFLTYEFDDSVLGLLVQNKFDLDIHHKPVTKELVQKCHDAGVEINCWTINSKSALARFQKMGVDYITTNKDWDK